MYFWYSLVERKSVCNLYYDMIAYAFFLAGYHVFYESSYCQFNGYLEFFYYYYFVFKYPQISPQCDDRSLDRPMCCVPQTYVDH